MGQRQYTVATATLYHHDRIDIAAASLHDILLCAAIMTGADTFLFWPAQEQSQSQWRHPPFELNISDLFEGPDTCLTSANSFTPAIAPAKSSKKLNAERSRMLWHSNGISDSRLPRLENLLVGCSGMDCKCCALCFQGLIVCGRSSISRHVDCSLSHCYASRSSNANGFIHYVMLLASFLHATLSQLACYCSHNNLTGMVKIEDPPREIFKMYVPDIKAFFESPASRPGDTFVCKSKLVRGKPMYRPEFELMASLVPEGERKNIKITLAAPEWVSTRLRLTQGTLAVSIRR